MPITDPEELRLISLAEEALQLAKRRPTGANMKAYRTAEKALADYRKERGGMQPGFANVMEVIDYLDATGWKISKTSCYDHVKERKLLPDPTGRYPVSAVLEYARVHLQTKDKTPGAIAGQSLQEQKLVEEVERIRVDRQHKDLKYRVATGELILKSEVEGELAKRAGYLKSDLKNVFRAHAVELIKQVAGDPQKAPDLIAYGIRLVDEMLDRYARPIVGYDEE